MISPEIPVPYVLAYSGEAVPQRLSFAEDPMSGMLRLSHRAPRPRSDWTRGVLLARIRTHQRGEVMWRMLNRHRQWQCMIRHLCQVCAGPATDPATGRLWWVITETGFRATESAGGLTNAPPTCPACIPASLRFCPQLRKSATVYTVGGVEFAGVLADLYEPGPGGQAVFAGERNVFVGWEEFAILPYALATQMVVRLHGMEPAPHLSPEAALVVAS
ncbi:hypothetical protein [Planobispora takensis]|uniref:Uncharacterized protein n=1 Tax=Planobispora takensis TaxID=1367882 RepID=A0A8J3WQ46_9ACTN|nr:hypothetical protein [Planobispora takensis]GIH98073.1 hypothetical protein Pta02_00820 [Planobispora takensis]